MKCSILLKNGRILDPANNRDEIGDICICGRKIVDQADIDPATTQVIDATGKWVAPGLIDMHVHLREPGQEYKETIESGTRAAAAGGFTAVVCMPNTKPINDIASVTRYILEKAAHCPARVYPTGAISCKSEGTGLAEYGEMKEAGIVAVTDDGQPVRDSQLMRRAMEYALSHELPLMSHSEEATLSRNGSMNEGLVSTQLGLRGIPAAAESIMVYREAALAELTGARIHISHVSTEASLAVIKLAKERGVAITAETAPHYFTLTDEAVMGYNTNAKMNPPLRSERDRQAIRLALRDGILDAIATDHAPHSVLEKDLEFSLAANGITGLETALPLTMALVRDRIITPSQLVQLMSVNPARILGLAGGNLAPGQIADLTIIDPAKQFTFTADASYSKSKNSPFLGWNLTGKAIMTIMDGLIRYTDEGGFI